MGALLCAYVQEQNGAATRQQPRPLRGKEIMNMVALGLQTLLEEDEKPPPPNLAFMSWKLLRGKSWLYQKKRQGERQQKTKMLPLLKTLSSQA